MTLHPQQQFLLRDCQGDLLGEVVITQVVGDLVFGQFTSGAYYEKVRPLFEEYVEAANQQLLSVVGELDEEISDLGLVLEALDGAVVSTIHDIQIGEGVITFRTQQTQPVTPVPPEEVARIPVPEARSPALGDRGDIHNNPL